MPQKGFRAGFKKQAALDIPKARWIAQFNGVRVYDETKVGNAQRTGLYVFLYPYDWGLNKDGVKMEGRKLGVAPFCEDEKGGIFWKGRQRAGKDTKGRPRLKYQFDLVAIAPEMAYALANAIRAVASGDALTEEAAESKIEDVAEVARTKELEDLLKYA